MQVLYVTKKDVTDDMLISYLNNEYCNYHKHCHYSNVVSIDSTVKPLDYINRAFELGHTTVFTTQHNTALGHYEYYDLINEANKLISALKENLANEEQLLKIIDDNKKFDLPSALECIRNNESYKLKYRFGTEIYFSITPEDVKMYHMIILARNKQGFKDINNLLGQCCFVEGGYRNKRAKVPFDEILKLDAKNVLITTACLASFINRLDKSIEIESATDEVVQEKESEIQLLGRLKDALGESFFIELQNHNTDKQKEYNKVALEYSRKLNIPIIAGMDSHMIYPEQEELRTNYLNAKGIYYEDESGWLRI